MSAAVPATAPRPEPALKIEPDAVLNALTDATIVVGPLGEVAYANAAAEQFFNEGARRLRGRALEALIPPDSPLFALIGQVREGGGSRTEYDLTIETPRIGTHLVTARAADLPEAPGHLVVTFHAQSVPRALDRQLSHRNAARSVTGLAAMLAHEVKNPLSGIRGAAQLLESGVAEEDRALTSLIREEADRICALVERVEVFSDDPRPDRGPVNIHEVLDRVRRVAEAGPARGVEIAERYDPSLPPVFGDRDQLIQVFLNLVKNAAEAMPGEGGEIAISTAYRHGVRVAPAGSGGRVHLPIAVSVTDNGAGIPEDLRSHLFDPFVTGKPAGKGLGLALVAKLVEDHGGVIEFESGTCGTEFRVLLPVHEGGEGESP